MEENQLNHIVYSKPVVEFVTVAVEFCKFAENAQAIPLHDFLTKAQKILPLVYLKGCMLPEVESISEQDIDKFVSEADWQYVFVQVEKSLGEEDQFVDILSPNKTDLDQVEELSISECFADIYQDLKNFTSLYQISSPDVIEEGIWECNQNFKQYWGPRILGIMARLHTLVYDEKFV